MADWSSGSIWSHDRATDLPTEGVKDAPDIHRGSWPPSWRALFCRNGVSAQDAARPGRRPRNVAAEPAIRTGQWAVIPRFRAKTHAAGMAGRLPIPSCMPVWRRLVLAATGAPPPREAPPSVKSLEEIEMAELCPRFLSAAPIIVSTSYRRAVASRVVFRRSDDRRQRRCVGASKRPATVQSITFPEKDVRARSDASDRAP